MLGVQADFKPVLLENYFENRHHLTCVEDHTSVCELWYPVSYVI